MADDTVDKAKQILSEVAHQAWREFSGLDKLSVEQATQRVGDFVKGLLGDVPPATSVQNLKATDDGALTFDVVSNDPKVCRILARLQDQEYQALVERIRAFAEHNPDGTYVMTPVESAIAGRHMEPYVTLTLTVNKEQP